MELRHSGLSPFVRKVVVVAHELGIVDRIRLVQTNPLQDPGQIVPLNPLGKIPTLVTDSGAVLFDSPVICEFLDAEYGDHRLLPAAGIRRWEIMTLVAIADGVMDAAILAGRERRRPAEQQSAEWLAWQLGKVDACLDRFETMADGFGGHLDMGQIAVGCAVGYMRLRLDGYHSFEKWPRLRSWFSKVSRRPSFRNTVPVLPPPAPPPPARPRASRPQAAGKPVP